MISIITGDIVNSRKISDQDIWQKPLKKLFAEWGASPAVWEIFRGDHFQVEITDPLESLRAAFRIKALIKSLDVSGSIRKSDIDVRMSIGIGTKDYPAKNITESNGTAFINSGENFDTLKKQKSTLSVKSPWKDFDDDMNLYLKLAVIQMDDWSISSGELVSAILKYPDKTQTEIGNMFGIEQNSVSGRYNRANVEEILEVERMFRNKLNK